MATWVRLMAPGHHRRSLQFVLHDPENVGLAVFHVQGLARNAQRIGLARSRHRDRDIGIGQQFAVLMVVDFDKDFAHRAGFEVNHRDRHALDVPMPDAARPARPT